MSVKKQDIDLQKVEAMAERFCKNDEIAVKLDFDKDAFEKRKDVKGAFERGRNSGRIGLRTLLFDAAQSLDRQAIIFLAKNELGYGDYQEASEQNAKIPRILDDVGERDADG